jgi:CRP/FNR family transcriptional regulator, cyclic AMP receptor protein
MTRSLHRVLGSHPFFEGLPERHLEILVGCASNRVYYGGDVILRQGDDATEFFLIRHGRVAIEIPSPGGPRTIQSLGPGEVMGWSWMAKPYRDRFDARATELSRVIALDGKCLRDKFESDHELAYELLRRFVGVIAGRLDNAHLQLQDLYGSASDGR